MKKKNFLIIIPCVLLGFFGSQYKTEASDEQEYKNLEKLCLVWGYTKYRHPVFLPIMSSPTLLIFQAFL